MAKNDPRMIKARLRSMRLAWILMLLSLCGWEAYEIFNQNYGSFMPLLIALQLVILLLCRTFIVLPARIRLSNEDTADETVDEPVEETDGQEQSIGFEPSPELCAELAAAMAAEAEERACPAEPFAEPDATDESDPEESAEPAAFAFEAPACPETDAQDGLFEQEETADYRGAGSAAEGLRAFWLRVKGAISAVAAGARRAFSAVAAGARRAFSAVAAGARRAFSAVAAGARRAAAAVNSHVSSAASRAADLELPEDTDLPEACFAAASAEPEVQPSAVSAQGDCELLEVEQQAAPHSAPEKAAAEDGEGIGGYIHSAYRRVFGIGAVEAAETEEPDDEPALSGVPQDPEPCCSPASAEQPDDLEPAAAAEAEPVRPRPAKGAGQTKRSLPAQKAPGKNSKKRSGKKH